MESEQRGRDAFHPLFVGSLCCFDVVGVCCMKEKKDPNMEAQHRAMMSCLRMKYRRILWDRFKDAVGVFFMAIVTLISTVLILGIIVFLIITLIEHPLSLTIICGTILLMWIWGNK